jgi:hypothetical protein
VRTFWPPSEAAQADYEALRAAVLAGTPLADPAALRFARAGLAALISHPAAETVFVAVVRGATRPRWIADDPRAGALAAGYRLVLASSPTDDGLSARRAVTDGPQR